MKSLRLLLILCFLGTTNLAISFSSSANTHSSDITLGEQSLSQEQSEAKLKQLKQNITKVNRWLARANKEKSGLSAELEKHDRSINRISKSIRHKTAQIKLYTKELKELTQEQKSYEKELNKHQGFLSKQLRSAYLYGEQPDLKVLLNSTNPQSLALDMRYFAAIKDAQNEEIQIVQNTLEKIRTTEKKILSKKIALDRQTKELNANKTELKPTQNKTQLSLSQLKKKIKNNNAKLSKLKNDQNRLQALLSEIEQAITDIPIPEDAEPFSKRKGKLPWPAKGKVSSRFGQRILQGKIKRNGITIATKDNQKVHAVHSGRVIFSNWIRGFGLLIIVDHGNNYMSLYGNNKSLAKDTGDWVRAKEVIGFAQDSSNEAESGLYFEIRKHGKPINPTRWLRK